MKNKGQVIKKGSFAKKNIEAETVFAQVKVMTATAMLLKVSDYPLRYSSSRNRDILNSIKSVSAVKRFR